MDTPTLLIVDDEKSIVNSLARGLRDQFAIFTAGSGAAALEVLAQQNIDLILTDERMPGMTGVELLAQAFRIQPAAIGIIISAYTDIEALTTALNLGNVRGYIPKPWDIEKLKNQLLQAVLRQNEHFIQQVLNTTPDGITIYDVIEKRNIYVNCGTEETLGYPSETIKNMPGGAIQYLAHPNDIVMLTEHFDRLAVTPNDQISIIQCQFKHGNGNWRTLTSWDRVLKRAADGKPRLILESIRDITESWRAEEALRQAQENLETKILERTAQLETANQELEAFSYSVSHDLRAPLRALEGFSKVLMEDCAEALDETGLGYVNRIYAVSQRMEQLVDGLLELSHTTRGDLDITRVNLSEIVQALCEALDESQPPRPIQWNIAPNVIVNGDKRLLEAALGNLLNNAYKFSAQQPVAHIEFGIKEENGQTVYYVRDDGVGFDMAYAGKLFSAFQRLHLADKFEGTGIGLTIVKRIINRHGGHIWAEAQVNQGATFNFTLG